MIMDYQSEIYETLEANLSLWKTKENKDLKQIRTKN